MCGARHDIPRGTRVLAQNRLANLTLLCVHHHMPVRLGADPLLGSRAPPAG